MSAISAIEWCDRTWNPVRGCSVISPGCVNCYAMRQAHRFNGPGRPYEGLTKRAARSGPQWTGQIRTVEDALMEPLKWRKPARVFVNSMSDLFHEGVPDEFIDCVFAVMALATRHTFQILTKRPERMRAYLTESVDEDGRFARQRIGLNALHMVLDTYPRRISDGGSSLLVTPGREGELAVWPQPNVWLGVSVEDQQRADERIPLLLQTPAAVRFISAEPLLGSVDLTEIPILNSGTGDEWSPLVTLNALDRPQAFGPHLDWVIVGGESGPGARPMCLSWVRNIVHDCADAKVPCFVKQLGAKPYEQYEDGGVFSEVRLYAPKGGDPMEWERYLRVREFPVIR